MVPFKAKCTADINGGKAVAWRLHDPQIVTVHAPQARAQPLHFQEHRFMPSTSRNVSGPMMVK